MRALLPLLLLAACARTGARALREPEMRAQLGAQVVATLDRQRHYFDRASARDAFARRIQTVASSTADALSFYRGLADALAELDEGHTGLVGSAEVPFSPTIPPVAILELDGQPVVAGVAPGVEAGGLRPGDVILKVDDIPATIALGERLEATAGSTEHGRRARAVSNLLAGPTRAPSAVTVRGMDGRERTCFPLRFLLDDEGEERFRFGFVPRAVTAMRVSVAAAYVSLPDFDPDRHREFEAALRPLSSLPLLILDLRGNPGGRIQTLQRIAGLFFDRPVELLQMRDRGRVEPLRAIPGDLYYRGRIRILMDERTGSAAELLAAALKDLGRGTLYGRASAGSVRARRSSLLPGGVVFHYAGTAEFRRRDGRVIEGAGVRPDVAAGPTRRELARGAYGDPVQDPVVRVALERN